MTGQKFEIRFGLFQPKKMSFRYGNMGVVLENAHGSVVLSGTDKTNNITYCAVPMGALKDYPGKTFQVVFVSESRCAVSSRSVHVLIDFQEHTVSSSEGFRVFGEPGKWGTDIARPWKAEYEVYF